MSSSQTGFTSKVSITRPADTTAYAANDVIGSSTSTTAAQTFNNIGGTGRSVYITGSTLLIESNAVISGETSYTLNLYSITPPSALADNAAFDLPAGDRAYFLGAIQLGTPVDLGSTLYVESNGINKEIKVGSSTSIFGYLVTNGAYTPTASRVYNVAITGFAI